MDTVLGCKNSTGMGGNGETFHGDGVGMGQFILLVQLLTSDAIQCKAKQTVLYQYVWNVNVE